MAIVRYEGTINVLVTPFEVGIRHFRLAFSEGTPDKLSELVGKGILYPPQESSDFSALTCGQRIKHIALGLLETVGYLTAILPFIVFIADRILNKPCLYNAEENQESPKDNPLQEQHNPRIKLTDFYVAYLGLETGSIQEINFYKKEQFEEFSLLHLATYNAKFPGIRPMESKNIPTYNFETVALFQGYVEAVEKFCIFKGDIADIEYICLVYPSSSESKKYSKVCLRYKHDEFA